MIALLLADDHAVVRSGLRRVLEDSRDMRVVAEAADAAGVLAELRAQHVDVLVLDISMPGPGFLELIRQIRRSHAGTRILIPSAHPERPYAVRALRAGAAGYVTKDRSADELEGAIRRVHGGARYVSPTLAQALAAAAAGDPRPRHEALSRREFQVLVRLGAGRSVKEAAADLALSPKTVSTYRTRLLEKLELKTSAELIRYAIENGLAQ